MVDIKNIVVFGDSMSDIGNKWTWPTGELGRLLNQLGIGGMRVNETGRFSDGRNWTDFLVQWATGESLMWGNRDLAIRKSTDHRTLTMFSSLEVSSWDMPPQVKPPTGPNTTLDDLLAYIQEGRKQETRQRLPEVKYVNYAMGGSIAANDWAPKFGALTYLRSQVEDYLAQRASLSRPLEGDTLHVIWIGLNDFVTALRPDYDRAEFKDLPAENEYGLWKAWAEGHKKELEKKGGVGAFPAVEEVRLLVEAINQAFPPEKNHFMVMDLPSVYNAVRYMDFPDTKPAKLEEAKRIDPVIDTFNEILVDLLKNWPGPNAPAGDHRHIVEVSKWMRHVSANLDGYKLLKQPQDHGVKPFYNPAVPPGPTTDPVPSGMRRRITTSDLGHPSEAVYELIAGHFVTRMLAENYTLGRLTMDSWVKNNPFGTVALDYMES
ncbi:hypothetical protein [Spirillospora sp. NPDC029432]|uniref:hypothetical protein n=1 Tax=Spirillospora sp. NPDC029432 TaxID=3154599 RepID=UPI0034540555